jgi:hypothetical protein
MDTICPRCGFVNLKEAVLCRECRFNFYEEESNMTPQIDTLQSSPATNYYQTDSQTISFDSSVRQFRTAGDALSPTFRLYKDNFILIAKIVLALYGPLVAIQHLLASRNDDDPLNGFMALLIYVASISLVPSALIYGITHYLRTGTNPSVLECYSLNLKRLARVFGAAILTNIIILLGTIIFIVPGIIAAITFSLVLPAIVLEDRTILGSMNRSGELTKGYRGRIFMAFLLNAILIAIISMLLTLASLKTDVSIIDTIVQSLGLEMLQVSSTIISVFIYHGIQANLKQQYVTN